MIIDDRRGGHRAKTIAAALAGLLVSIVFCVLTVGDFRRGAAGIEFVPRIDTGTLRTALAQVHWSAILAFVICTIGTLPLRAIQWGALLTPSGSFRDRYHASAVGFMAINTLPARSGEAVRGWLLALRVPGLTRSHAIGSAIHLRVYEIFAVWVLALPLPFIVHVIPSQQGLIGWGFAGLTGLAWGAVGLTWVARRYGPAIGALLMNFVNDDVGQACERFCEELGRSAGWGSVARGLGWTLIFQALSAFSYVAVIAEVCPDLPAVSVAFFGFAAVSVGLAMPSTPSNIGVYHFSLALALRAVGATGAQAIAVAVVTHLAMLGSFVLAGFVSIIMDWPMGMRLRESMKVEAEGGGWAVK